MADDKGFKQRAASALAQDLFALKAALGSAIGPVSTKGAIVLPIGDIWVPDGRGQDAWGRSTERGPGILVVVPETPSGMPGLALADAEVSLADAEYHPEVSIAFFLRTWGIQNYWGAIARRLAEAHPEPELQMITWWLGGRIFDDEDPNYRFQLLEGFVVCPVTRRNQAYLGSGANALRKKPLTEKEVLFLEDPAFEYDPKPDPLQDFLAGIVGDCGQWTCKDGIRTGIGREVSGERRAVLDLPEAARLDATLGRLLGRLADELYQREWGKIDGGTAEWGDASESQDEVSLGGSLCASLSAMVSREDDDLVEIRIYASPEKSGSMPTAEETLQGLVPPDGVCAECGKPRWDVHNTPYELGGLCLDCMSKVEATAPKYTGIETGWVRFEAEDGEESYMKLGAVGV